MEARWTLAMVRAELVKRRENLTSRIGTSVLIVTADGVHMYDRAMAERIGEYYLVWTDMRGDFVEHQDNVIACRAYCPLRLEGLSRR